MRTLVAQEIARSAPAELPALGEPPLDDGPPPGDLDWQELVAAAARPELSHREAASHTAAENGTITCVPANPQRGTGAITDRQLKAIYVSGRNVRHADADAVTALCQDTYHCRPEELSKAEASQFIDVLKGEAAG